MALNATVPASRPGPVPPHVWRSDAIFYNRRRQEPMTPPQDRPAPRNPKINRVYTEGVRLNLTV